MVAVDK